MSFVEKVSGSLVWRRQVLIFASRPGLPACSDHGSSADSFQRAGVVWKETAHFHQVSNEMTHGENTEKVTQTPLEREVFAEVVWQWGTRYVKLCTKGKVSPGRRISGCQQRLHADVLPDAFSYALPPPMAQTQVNLREGSSAILLFRSSISPAKDDEKLVNSLKTRDYRNC